MEWPTILLLLFWRDLERIGTLLERLDDDDLALRTNVHWAFSEAVHCFDPAKRPERVIQKLRNDTIRGVKQIYSAEPLRSWRFEQLDCGGDEDEGEDSKEEWKAPEDPEWVQMHADLEKSSCICQLQSLAEQGYIADRDLPLLVGTIIYGQTIAEFAAEQGLPKETAKKRRQRALASIRRHLKDLEEM